MRFRVQNYKSGIFVAKSCHNLPKGGAACLLSQSGFIEISAKGTGKAKKDVDDIKQKVEQGEEATKKWDKAITAMSRGFMAATAAATLLLKKGLNNTEEGERLGKAIEKVAERVASLLLPIINFVTTAIEMAADAFDYMGAHGQTAFLMLAAAAATFMAVISGGIIPALAAIGLGFAAIVNLSEGEDRKPSKVTKKSDKKLAVEDPTAIWKRIQETVSGMGFERENNASLKSIAGSSLRSADNLARLKPAVG